MSRQQQSSSSLPQWPVCNDIKNVIELETLHPNNDLMVNDISNCESLTTDILSSRMNGVTEYSDKKIAAQVKNVVFSYGRGKNAVNALNGITINVPEGHM